MAGVFVRHHVRKSGQATSPHSLLHTVVDVMNHGVPQFQQFYKEQKHGKKRKKIRFQTFCNFNAFTPFVSHGRVFSRAACPEGISVQVILQAEERKHKMSRQLWTKKERMCKQTIHPRHHLAPQL